MIKALDTATQGLLQAERRANDVALDILKSTSESATFKLEDQATGAAPAPQAGQPTASVSATGYGDLIQQMADLKASELSFKANAKVFKAADESLGSLLDALG